MGPRRAKKATTKKDQGVNRRQFLSHAAIVGAIEFAGARARAADGPDAIVIDYAYYNPVSLLLKKKGWLESELAKDGVGVRWVLSLGSNKALEFLRGGSIDFGSTAGSAAIVARAGGTADQGGLCLFEARMDRSRDAQGQRDQPNRGPEG